MEDIQVDHPYVVAEETKNWLKLDNLNDASPSDIVLMKNMDVLLYLLQKTLRTQETIILKVDKRSTLDDAKPTVAKIQPKWLKLTHTRSATPPQFVIMSNLWQLFQILQSLQQSQEKVLQTLDTRYTSQKRRQKGKAKSRPKRRRTSISNHIHYDSGSNHTNSDDESDISIDIGGEIDTDHDPSSDDDNEPDRDSGCGGDASIDHQALQPSNALLNIMNNALDYAYEVYDKFLATTGCHPYVANTASCQKASRAFYRYFIDHEDLVGDSEILPSVRQLDDDDARKLFVALSKKHNKAKGKGKRSIDEEPATHKQPMPNELSYEYTSRRAYAGQTSHDSPLFMPQDGHGSSLSDSHPNPHKQQGFPEVISLDSDDESAARASVLCHGRPQIITQPHQMQPCSSTRGLQSTSRNLPSSSIASVQRPINGIPRLASAVKNTQACGLVDPLQAHKKQAPYSASREPREILKEKRNPPEIVKSKMHYR